VACFAAPAKRKLFASMKSTFKPKRYPTNWHGQRIGVVLDIRVYRKMIADIEELETILAYDTAKMSGDKRIPLKEAARKIERLPK
jgi:hypothetical protein